MKFILIALLSVIFISACKKDNSTRFKYVERIPIMDEIYKVDADSETEPIRAEVGADAADDPAVWIHPSDPTKSIIYGSNKLGGIAAYDLTGKEIMYTEQGSVNNIDIAYNLKLKDETIDICGGSNRTRDAIDIYKIDPETGGLEYILEERVISTVSSVYGFCFYHSQITSINYALVSGKDGVIEQYEIIEGNEKLSLKLVSTFSVPSMPEGIVADHKHGFIYVGEEDECVWKVGAEPGVRNMVKLGYSIRANNDNIKYDIEGLAIYYTSSDYGYLLVSSQGNSSYAIFTRTNDNAYIGSFQIEDGVVDGTTETDGIDVVNLNLGSDFPLGAFIVQDNINDEADHVLPQNFKMVDWGKIANLFDPPLLIDSNFNVRELFK